MGGGGGGGWGLAIGREDELFGILKPSQLNPENHREFSQCVL